MSLEGAVINIYGPMKVFFLSGSKNMENAMRRHMESDEGVLTRPYPQSAGKGNPHGSKGAAPAGLQTEPVLPATAKGELKGNGKVDGIRWEDNKGAKEGKGKVDGIRWDDNSGDKEGTGNGKMDGKGDKEGKGNIKVDGKGDKEGKGNGEGRGSSSSSVNIPPTPLVNIPPPPPWGRNQ